MSSFWPKVSSPVCPTCEHCGLMLSAGETNGHIALFSSLVQDLPVCWRPHCAAYFATDEEDDAPPLPAASDDAPLGRCTALEWRLWADGFHGPFACEDAATCYGPDGEPLCDFHGE